MRIGPLSLSETAEFVAGAFLKSKGGLSGAAGYNSGQTPETPLVGFLRAADAYSGSIDEASYKELGRLAVSAAGYKPYPASWYQAARLTAEVAGGYKGAFQDTWAADHLLAQLKQGDHRARALAMHLINMADSRKDRRFAAECAAMGMGFWINSAGVWHCAPAVLVLLMGGHVVAS